MPHTIGPLRLKTPKLTLNSDGRRHPLENALTLTALGLGLVALVCGLVTPAHAAASWAGVLGFPIGLYAQYVSATTEERSVNIVAIIMSFVGAALGIYHGGFLF